MTKALPALQLACLALIALALAPVSLRALDQRRADAERLARAEALGDIGRTAMQAGDPDLAAQAFADATGLAPELAIIGFGVLLGSYIVRGMIHPDHVRLLSTESLLERAEAIARPPKKPVAVPSSPAT
jgi:hypothetical protein